jgi:hypothetical protein
MLITCPRQDHHLEMDTIRHSWSMLADILMDESCHGILLGTCELLLSFSLNDTGDEHTALNKPCITRHDMS